MTLNGLYPLPPRTFLLVEGADRLRFLNGQVSNDVQRVEEGECLYATVLNAKGQLDAVCHIRKIPGAYLIDAAREVRESLLERLDRYLIADEVTLTDVSDDWRLCHAVGSGLQDLGAPLPKDLLTHALNRFGVPGTELLGREPLDIPKQLLLEAGAMEALRIYSGVPAWGTELTVGQLPPEAGLDRTAISYDKGCYLGQEVISRMKRAGKTNRHLVQWEVPAGTAPGTPLLVEDTPAGVITSVAPGGSGETTTALGFRQRKFEGTERFPLPHGAGHATVRKRLA